MATGLALAAAAGTAVGRVVHAASSLPPVAWMLGQPNQAQASTGLLVGGVTDPAVVVQSTDGPSFLGITSAGLAPGVIGIAGIDPGPAPVTLTAMPVISGVLGVGVKGTGVRAHSENHGAVLGVSLEVGVTGVIDRPVASGRTGDRQFFVDESGVIRFTTAGQATSQSTPVGGPLAAGVRGLAVDMPAVHAISVDNVGVLGASEVFDTDLPPPATLAAGVLGTSLTRVGVRGMSRDNAGIVGTSASSTQAGVRAENTGGGLALDVLGRARFQMAGSGAIPDGSTDFFVQQPGVTASSVVLATLEGDPSKNAIEWIEPNAGSGFTIHMTHRVKGTLAFGYLIVELPPTTPATAS